MESDNTLKSLKSIILKVVAICLVLALFAPATAYAAEDTPISPYASYYLDTYNTYICRVGTNGQIQIWFDVMGTGDMDEIGVLSIILYESTDNINWTRVKTFSHENYSSMLVYDDWYHASYVSYQGSTTKYYKAYVCIWAGKNGGGDTRYMWATMV